MFRLFKWVGVLLILTIMMATGSIGLGHGKPNTCIVVASPHWPDQNESYSIIDPLVPKIFHVSSPYPALKPADIVQPFIFVDPNTLNRRYFADADLKPYIPTAWTPDGKQVASLSDKSGEYDLIVTELDTQTVRRITIQDAADMLYAAQLSWSGDGQYIAVLYTRTTSYGNVQALAIIRAIPGAPLKQVAEYNTNVFAWATHSNHFIYKKFLDDFKFALVEGNPLDHIEHRTDPQIDSSYGPQLLEAGLGNRFDWSPNGDYLAIVWSAQGGASVMIIDKFGQPRATVDQATAFNLGGLALPDIGWTADGSAYVFWPPHDPSSTGYSNSAKLSTFSSKTGTIQSIADNVVQDYRQPVIRQANQLAFRVWQDASPNLMQLVVMNADGSHKLVLMHDKEAIDTLSWSPDGRTLVAVGTRTGQDAELMWAGTDGKDIHRLNYPEARFLSWSPAQQSLLFLAKSGGKAQLIRAELATGKLQVLIPDIPSSVYDESYLAAFYPSPDQQHVAVRFTNHALVGEGGPGEPVTSLYLTDWQGHLSKLLEKDGDTYFIGEVVWNGKGDAFAYNLMGLDATGTNSFRVQVRTVSGALTSVEGNPPSVDDDEDMRPLLYWNQPCQ